MDIVEIPGDDYATTDNLLISPEVFETMLKPALERITRPIEEHRQEFVIASHSDGAIRLNGELRKRYGAWTTAIYYSEVPNWFHSGEDACVCEVKNVLAAELVRDEDRMYIARVSRKLDARTPTDGYVEVARLEFR